MIKISQFWIDPLFFAFLLYDRKNGYFSEENCEKIDNSEENDYNDGKKLKMKRVKWDKEKEWMKKYFIFKKYEWRNNGHFLSFAQKVVNLYINKVCIY